MKSFKDYVDEIAANAVAGGGVSLPPVVHNKDKRKKYNIDRMYRRSLGLKALKEKDKKKND